VPFRYSDISIKVDWYYLSQNTNIYHIICRIDYEKMKQNTKYFCEELVKHVFHPVKIDRMSKYLNIEFDEYIEYL
jgi:hypothetical protein